MSRSCWALLLGMTLTAAAVARSAVDRLVWIARRNARWTNSASSNFVAVPREAIASRRSPPARVSGEDQQQLFKPSRMYIMVGERVQGVGVSPFGSPRAYLK